MKLHHTLAPALLALLLGCGGTSALGEACDTAGSVDECETGAVCTNDTSEVLTCRKVCTDQAQCASTENCNGVSGTSTKSCQPK